MSAFKPASRTRKKLRIALTGGPNAGKTWTALAIASGLGGRIALIDTEHGSASAYAGDPFDFDTLELGNFDPRLYVQAIQDAEKEGYSVIIIDSLSHAWTGKGGALELVDKITLRSQSKNAFTEGWSQVTPLQNQLIDAIISCSAHVIATMRTKVEYVTEKDPRTGKMAPRKVGMAPIQREGMAYEFDIVGEMDDDHNLIVAKTRWSKLDGEIIRRPGTDLGKMLLGWLNDVPQAGASDQVRGTKAEAPSAPGRPTLGLASPDHVAELRTLFAAIGLSDFQVREALAKRGAAVVESLSVEDAQAMIHKMRAHLESVTAADQIQARIEGASPEEAAQRAGARPGVAKVPDSEPTSAEVGSVPEAGPAVDSVELSRAMAAQDGSGPDPYVPASVGGSAEQYVSPDDFVIPDQPRRDAPSTSSSSSSGSRSTRKGKTALANEAVTQPVTS